MANTHITTMSYDLETTDDNNINQEIKDFLIAKGWNFSIPESMVDSYLKTSLIEKYVDTPMTTAWKSDIIPEDACGKFVEVIMAYNANHTVDKKSKFGRGSAFAVCDNLYKAVRIE